MRYANTMKKTQFEKKENWGEHTFYLIYIRDEIKMIKLIGALDRQSMDKSYLSWICIYCGDDCEMPLEDFLLWDVYYQKDHLLQNSHVEEVEVEPYECFDQANKWVRGDGNGSTFRRFLDITENIACGYYYGY